MKKKRRMNLLMDWMTKSIEKNNAILFLFLFLPIK